MYDQQNIAEVAELHPDYMGFIFYDKSKRYFEQSVPVSNLDLLPKKIKKVGVFVNEAIEKLEEIAEKYNIEILQLHGQESPQYCIGLRQKGYTVWKAFAIDESFDFEETEQYYTAADVFLFDTKTPIHGGAGVTFDWKLLEKYSQFIPFMLAGGVSLQNIDEAIKATKHMNIHGIDINSKFEKSDGLKVASKVWALIENIRK